MPAAAVTVPNGRPDVHIYNQREVWRTGGSPTWDSPDIWTWRGRNGQVGPLEEIIIRLHNRSTLAPAKGAVVTCELAALGIATPGTELFSSIVTIPPATTIEIRHATPPDVMSGARPPGAHVTARLPGDLYGADNHGAQVTHGVHTSRVGRTPSIDFPVANRTFEDLQLSLHTLPNDLSAQIEPATLSLAPQEQAQARLSCTVEPGLHPPPGANRFEATVFARDAAGDLYGGLTLFVIVDD